MKHALTVARYALWPVLILAPWFILLTWGRPAVGQLPTGNALFTYFLAFVLVVGVILSLILRHLIQRSRRQSVNPAKLYTYMEEVLRKDPSPSRFLEAGVFCGESGEWERAIQCLRRVRPQDGAYYRTALYHLVLAHLEIGGVEEAARLQAQLPVESLTSDERYNIALAYKKHNFLGRAKELFLKLFLMDIAFRDVGRQLEEIGNLERSSNELPADFAFLAGVMSERYSSLKVTADLGSSVACTAHDRDLGRSVVLRALKPERATEEGIEAFLSQARSLAAIDHPSVLKVYDIRKDRLPYFCVEAFEGQPLQAVETWPLERRADVLGRLVDLMSRVDGAAPEAIRVNERGELRLTALGGQTAPWGGLSKVLGGSGSAPPVVEHAWKGVQVMLEARAPLGEVGRAVEVLATALRLDAEERDREAFATAVRWLERVHRHWVHALKSKFAVVKRYPGEPDRALAIFGRRENLEEVDRMLVGLTEELERAAGLPGVRAPALRGLAEELGALEVGQMRERIREIGRMGRPEASAEIAALAERFVGLSAALARLLEGFEADLAALAEGVVRGSVYAEAIQFENSGESRWTIRVARPDTFRKDVATAMDNVLHNAFEAGAVSVVVRLARGADRRFVTLRLEDDGCGVPPEVLERVARERFTSKPDGSGTGIMTSMRLVERHGGVLEIETRGEARGTRVRITLPTMLD